MTTPDEVKRLVEEYVDWIGGSQPHRQTRKINKNSLKTY
jgi:hypothetical protein